MKFRDEHTDVTRPAQENIFHVIDHLTVYFNKAPLVRNNCTMHLGLCLDE